MVLRIGISELSERSIVVVACRLRLIRTVIGVGTVGIVEVRSAMEHVNAHRNVVLQHPVELFCRSLIINSRVRQAPHIEPCRIELSHKVRAARIESVYRGHYILAYSTVHSW